MYVYGNMFSCIWCNVCAPIIKSFANIPFHDPQLFYKTYSSLLASLNIWFFFAKIDKSTSELILRTFRIEGLLLFSSILHLVSEFYIYTDTPYKYIFCLYEKPKKKKNDHSALQIKVHYRYLKSILWAYSKRMTLISFSVTFHHLS